MNPQGQILLIKISPHCSDNLCNKLYETMLIEYALGTACHSNNYGY